MMNVSKKRKTVRINPYITDKKNVNCSSTKKTIAAHFVASLLTIEKTCKNDK
jgi:hypothetical protein